MANPTSNCYVDTHVVVWLAEGRLDKISEAALAHMGQSSLLLSPIILMELQYLFEIGRIQRPARDILTKLEVELGVTICSLSFHLVVSAALEEQWTRDVFDRTIVAHAKAAGFAPLISRDAKIREFYPKTIW